MNWKEFKHQFKDFQFKNDTIASNFNGFDEFFKQFNENKSDSLSAESGGKDRLQTGPKTMNDLMKILQQQMKELQESQQQFFQGQAGSNKF